MRHGTACPQISRTARNFGDSILNLFLNRPRGKGVNAGVSRRCGKQQIEFDILSPKLRQMFVLEVKCADFSLSLY